MLNAVTIATIVAAVWAHPQGISYLEKIDQIEQLSISCGNPCCQLGSGQHRAREEELWKNLREPWQYKPKEEQKIEVIPPVFLPATENVSPEEIVEILQTVVARISSPTPLAVVDEEQDDEVAILLLLGVL